MTVETTDGSKDSGEYKSLLRPKPKPMNSLLASAQRITSGKVSGIRIGTNNGSEWQNDAWGMFDIVGEQRFLATTLAGRLSQARLFVGKIPDDPTDEPEPLEDGLAFEAFEAFGNGSQTARAQILARLGVNLFVAGDGWLAGIPRKMLRESRGDEPIDSGLGITPVGSEAKDEPDGEGLDITDLDWKMLSVSEVKFDREGIVTLEVGSDSEGNIKCKPDDIFLIRVWRPHPNHWWEADSPTRASLPVLRELVGLTMHISAQVDSRLAGAGVFIVPQSAKDAVVQQAGLDEDDEESDPFTEALMEAMITPISDRSAASAYVPLVLTVPDAVADKFQHITFTSGLDAEARSLRDESIRRLALGQDAPPEILLGTGGMNHWGAWLVREDTITTHIEPPLALICDAITSQYLAPVLEQQGMSTEEVEQYVVWYDVSDMIMRPNRSTDAFKVHGAGALSDDALRDATGFGEQDAPEEVVSDPIVDKAIELVTQAPSLAQRPGIAALVQQLRDVYDGKKIEDLDSDGSGEVDDVDESEDDDPDTDSEDDSNDETSENDDGGTPDTEPDGESPSGGEGLNASGLIRVHSPNLYPATETTESTEKGDDESNDE